MMLLIFLTGYLALSLRTAWVDYRTGYLPDRLTCPLLWLGLSCHLWVNPAFLADAVAGALVGWLLFWGIYQLFKWCRGYEGLGYGDIKLLAALGAWHGWQQLGLIILLASVGGLLASLLPLIAGTKPINIKTPLPFGPFLAVAGLVAGWQVFRLPVANAIALLL